MKSMAWIIFLLTELGCLPEDCRDACPTYNYAVNVPPSCPTIMRNRLDWSGPVRGPNKRRRRVSAGRGGFPAFSGTSLSKTHRSARCARALKVVPKLIRSRTLPARHRGCFPGLGPPPRRINTNDPNCLFFSFLFRRLGEARRVAHEGRDLQSRLARARSSRQGGPASTA